MNKNLKYKTIFILIVVVLALLTLYPPNETLKPGIDLAGGSSITLEINTQGLKRSEQDNLSQKMITVLRRRIDPANIQNLVWRSQGNTRFEIQMPLANEETRRRRQAYETALNDLLAKNTNPATIMRSLQAPQEERRADIESFAQDDPNRLAIIEELALLQRLAPQERLQLRARWRLWLAWLLFLRKRCGRRLLFLSGTQTSFRFCRQRLQLFNAVEMHRRL